MLSSPYYCSSSAQLQRQLAAVSSPSASLSSTVCFLSFLIQLAFHLLQCWTESHFVLWVTVFCSNSPCAATSLVSVMLLAVLVHLVVLLLLLLLVSLWLLAFLVLFMFTYVNPWVPSVLPCSIWSITYHKIYIRRYMWKHLKCNFWNKFQELSVDNMFLSRANSFWNKYEHDTWNN